MGGRLYDEEKGGIVTLNVGGQNFATSEATLLREPSSMLGRMVDTQLNTRRDSEGRIFIDRDPKHFRIVLNYLRDGACQLPTEEAEIQELLQEIEFYQLTCMRTFVLGEEETPLAASHVRYCIVHKIQSDPQLREALDLIIESAFGCGNQGKIPARKTRVDLVVKEHAFNPLRASPNQRCRDEALYVGFQQDLRIQGRGARRCKRHKHESAFIHEDEFLSYDHRVYGVTYEDRARIKTMDVFRHHCIHNLSEEDRRLRDVILYIEQNSDAIAWGLELEGYKDVRLVFHSRHVEVCDPPDSPPGSPTKSHQQDPVLCHINLEIFLSL